MTLKTRYFELFPDRKGYSCDIFPVIHLRYGTDGTTLSNLQMNLDIIRQVIGIRMVFLIDHDRSSINLQSFLVRNALKIKGLMKGFNLGINFLGTTPEHVYEIYCKELEKSGIKVDAIWSDTKPLDKSGIFHQNIQAILDSKTLFFAPFAFKYQVDQKEEEENPGLVKTVIEYSDVIVTSGSATGNACDVSKIVELKKHTKITPLAIASGIDSNNINQFINTGMNCCLVATSITDHTAKDGEVISLSKLSELMSRTRI